MDIKIDNVKHLTNEKPFGMKDKLGYMLGNLGNDFPFQFTNMFLMMFYTKVLGIAPSLVGILFLLSRVLDAFTDISEQALAKGETIRLVGFGAFVPEHKTQRNGTNPKTQEKIVIKERNTVKFKPGKDLKNIMN